MISSPSLCQTEKLFWTLLSILDSRRMSMKSNYSFSKSLMPDTRSFSSSLKIRLEVQIKDQNGLKTRHKHQLSQVNKPIMLILSSRSMILKVPLILSRNRRKRTWNFRKRINSWKLMQRSTRREPSMWERSLVNYKTRLQMMILNSSLCHKQRASIDCRLASFKRR